MAVGILAGACFVSDASAVITFVAGYTGTRTLTLRVGTSAGAIDTVQFDVGGSIVGNSLPAATSAAYGNNVPVAASSGGVPIRMMMQVPSGNVPQLMITTVTSPAALNCDSGGCGSAAIPFSDISWVMTPSSSVAYTVLDLQNGKFVSGGGTQNLFGFMLTSGAGTFDVANTMNFFYANTTAYPAGNYKGTVVYTATLL